MSDMRSLATLLAVIEYGSIHLAAKSLYVSHSTASRQIAALEEHYGSTLLERSQTGVMPTAAGLAVADFARRTIGESQLLIDSLSGSAGAVEHIRISTSIGLGQSVVAEAVRTLLQKETPVRCSLDYRDSLEAVRALHNRQAEFCVAFAEPGTVVRAGRGATLSAGAIEDSVAVHRPVEQRLQKTLPGLDVLAETLVPNVAVVDRDHPLAQRTSLRVFDLVDYPVATLPAGNTIRQQFDRAYRALGRVFVPSSESTCPVTTVRSLIGTSAVTVIARRTIPPEALHGPCTAIPIDDALMPPRTIQVLAHADSIGAGSAAGTDDRRRRASTVRTEGDRPGVGRAARSLSEPGATGESGTTAKNAVAAALIAALDR